MSRKHDWFAAALQSAKQRAALDIAGNAYLDKLTAKGSFPGMLRFMADEYLGPGGGSTTTQTANTLKRAALLRAADMVEQMEKDQGA